MASSSQTSPGTQLAAEIEDSLRIEELSSASEGETAASDQQWELAEQEVTTSDQVVDDDDDSSDSDSSDQDSAHHHHVHGWLASKVAYANLPHLFSHPPLLQDSLLTETSEKHNTVMRACLDILTNKDDTAQEIKDLNSHGLPKLQRHKHIKFLRNVLGQYPPPFQTMDASRPWLIYWALAGLSSLGVDVTPYKRRCINTFLPLQNPTGGFGGGHGQTSHCAASYAAVLSLAMVDGLDMIDRRTMWLWLGSVKQPDGAFCMAVGGEKDVRGAYCALTIHTLLNLPPALPASSPAAATCKTFTTGLRAWISKCQTYEGGIGAAPDAEAHGAFAFCALAALCLLSPPHISIPSVLNLPRLTSWLSARQSAPEGGLAGRTNKLVDACYSHWLGGCWALVEAAWRVPRGTTLWSREGMVRYTLCLSQTKRGGLRDKPGTRPDGYHTCYSLAGLSAAQNLYYYAVDGATGLDARGDGTTEVGRNAEPDDEETPTPLLSAFNWRAERASTAERRRWCFDEDDTVGFVHPVFVIPMEAVRRARTRFADVEGF